MSWLRVALAGSLVTPTCQHAIPKLHGCALGALVLPVTHVVTPTCFIHCFQVFQCHYMRYLYTLFGDQPPKYILDAGQ